MILVKESDLNDEAIILLIVLGRKLVMENDTDFDEIWQSC
jgi:hypothetical protein